MSGFENVTHRYAAYCRAHGAESPEAMLERDSVRWPGGKMCGFILWSGERWKEWRKANGKVGARLIRDDHVKFDAWISGVAA